MRNLQTLFEKGQRLLRDREFKKAELVFLKLNKLAPNVTQALEALGIIALETRNFSQAKKYLLKAIKIAPSSEELQNLMGTILQANGTPHEAIIYFERAIILNGSYSNAHYNYARSLVETGSIVMASKYFSIYSKQKPNDFDAHITYLEVLLNNSAHQKAEEFLGSLGSRAFLNARFLNLLARTSAGLGEYERSLENFYSILKQNLNDWMTYKKIGIVLKAAEISQGVRKNNAGNQFHRIRSIVLNAPQVNLLEYWFSSFSHLEQKDYFQLALRRFPEPDSKVLVLDAKSPIVGQKNKQVKEPKNVVALLHWGRSGTGFLHSLVDNHPEVITVPGQYCAGFFEKNVWDNIFSEDLQQMVQNCTEMYEIFFNPEAKSPPGVVLGHATSEGYGAMGQNKNQSLRIDQRIFEKCLLDQLRCRDKINQGIFFKCLHIAYQQTLGKTPDASHIFYHIHSPTRYALFNFLSHFPKAKFLMTVREPIQNFESWVSTAVQEKQSYEFVVERAANFLFEFDQKLFSRFSSRGIKLEDIKVKTSETMTAMCRWMEIETSNTLFESSFRG